MTDDTPDPRAVQAAEDRRERLRRVAQNLLDHQARGHKCDAEALQWARNIVRNIPPRGRPLVTGEPS